MRSPVTIFVLIAASLTAFGQKPRPLTSAEAHTLITRALAVEAREAGYRNHPMRFILHKTTPNLTSTKEMIETRDGDVARLIAINGKPLSPADKKKENARLDALLSDPGLQEDRKKSEDADTERVLKVLRLLPTAFIYKYEGVAKTPKNAVVKFTFKPNPQFNPPDLEARVLTAMTGTIWIDEARDRVMRIEAHLVRNITYGWGILGQLNKGGWVVIDQADVGSNQWRIVYIKVILKGRIFFKGKNFNSKQECTDYRPVPAGLSYRQAIELLRKSPSLYKSSSYSYKNKSRR